MRGPNEEFRTIKSFSAFHQSDKHNQLSSRIRIIVLINSIISCDSERTLLILVHLVRLAVLDIYLKRNFARLFIRAMLRIASTTISVFLSEEQATTSILMTMHVRCTPNQFGLLWITSPEFRYMRLKWTIPILFVRQRIHLICFRSFPSLR